MRDEIGFLVGGSLPYQQRMQLLDLLFWRPVQYVASADTDLFRSSFMPIEVRRYFSDLHRTATTNLERLRTPGDFVFGEPPSFVQRLFTTAGVRALPKPEDRGLLFYPAQMRARYTRPLVDEILDQEALALPGAGVALAAAGYAPFHISSVVSINPLSIRGALFGVAAVISAATYSAHVAYEHPHDEHMRTVCERLADNYADELDKVHVDKQKLMSLAQGLSVCLNSPIFNSNPIKIDFGGGEKP